MKELWRSYLQDDGHVDTVDIDLLVASIASGASGLEFDLTGDGQVNQQDVDEWRLQAGTAKLAEATPFLEGDANLDGDVDGQDFLVWNANKFSNVAAWSAGDFTSDGVIDGRDFLVWNTNKFSSAVSSSPLAVPDPNGFVLCLTAIVLIWWRRRRIPS